MKKIFSSGSFKTNKGLPESPRLDFLEEKEGRSISWDVSNWDYDPETGKVSFYGGGLDTTLSREELLSSEIVCVQMYDPNSDTEVIYRRTANKNQWAAENCPKDQIPLEFECLEVTIE